MNIMKTNLSELLFPRLLIHPSNLRTQLVNATIQTQLSD